MWRIITSDQGCVYRTKAMLGVSLTSMGLCTVNLFPRVWLIGLSTFMLWGVRITTFNIVECLPPVYIHIYIYQLSAEWVVKYWHIRKKIQYHASLIITVILPLNAIPALLMKTSTPPYFSLKKAAAVVMLLRSLMSSWWNLASSPSEDRSFTASCPRPLQQNQRKRKQICDDTLNQRRCFLSWT